MANVKNVYREIDIVYFIDYKNRLNEFIQYEIATLRVGKYMKLVDEVKDIENHIIKLKSYESV